LGLAKIVNHTENKNKLRLAYTKTAEATGRIRGEGGKYLTKVDVIGQKIMVCILSRMFLSDQGAGSACNGIFVD